MRSAEEVRLALKSEFDRESTDLRPEIYQIEDVALLQALQDALETVNTPAELRRMYQQTN
jgi:hypothetical protein